MARQIKRVLHRRTLFICVHINKGTRTRKGRCVRENVWWTFDQQRVRACTACAGRRMHSIRASPSWRTKQRDSNPTLTMFAPTPSASLSVFSMNRLTALRKKRRRAAASERMSGGHSISSVSKHAQDAGCIAYGQVPHGAPNKGTRTQCSICFCELLYFILCFQIVVIYNILILN